MYISLAYRPNTKRTYSSAQRAYIDFCTKYGLEIMPASEATILYFIAYTQARTQKCDKIGSGMMSSSLKVYLAAIRSLHVDAGLEPPPTSAPRVKLVLKAIHDHGPPTSHQIPITFPLLQQMIATLGNSYEHVMWQSLWTLGFFRGLRGAEYTLHLSTQGEPLSEPLMLSHVKHSQNPIPHIRLFIPRTKTCPHGTVRIIGCSGSPICAPCSLLEYLRLRHSFQHLHNAPYLYVGFDGKPVIKSQLNVSIKKAVSSLSLDPAHYSSHSLRAGVATQAGVMGFQDWQIKELGSWASDTYMTYIRPQHTHSLYYARRLIRN